MNILCLTISELTTFCGGGHISFACSCKWESFRFKTGVDWIVSSFARGRDSLQRRLWVTVADHGSAPLPRLVLFNSLTREPEGWPGGFKEEKIEKWDVYTLWEVEEKTIEIQVKLISTRQKRNSKPSTLTLWWNRAHRWVSGNDWLSGPDRCAAPLPESGRQTAGTRYGTEPEGEAHTWPFAFPYFLDIFSCDH